MQTIATITFLPLQFPHQWRILESPTCLLAFLSASLLGYWRRHYRWKFLSYLRLNSSSFSLRLIKDETLVSLGSLQFPSWVPLDVIVWGERKYSSCFESLGWAFCFRFWITCSFPICSSFSRHCHSIRHLGLFLLLLRKIVADLNWVSHHLKK